MGSPERVAVVGAGAVGLTTAYDLASRGAQVTLFERDEPGSGMTDRAAGICYDAYAEDIDVSVADRAMDRFRSLSGDGEFVFHETPYVFLAREGDESAATALTESVERMRVHDRDVSLVDTAELGERFPIRTDDIALAGVAENAGWADPVAYVDLFVEKCERAGVEFRVGDEVAVRAEPPTVVVTDELSARFDAVVVAAGIDSRCLLADAGYLIALKPYRAQALVGECDYRGPIVYDATDGSYLRPHPAGVLAGDGVEAVEADSDDWDPAADDWFIEDALDTARHRTKLDPELGRAWAGLCGSTPDNNPLVGEVVDGVYVATGWHGHGFMWAPAMGESLAEAVLGDGRGSIPKAFDPSRFDGDESFTVVEGMTLDGEGDDGDSDVGDGDNDDNDDNDGSDDGC
ncbi:FAD-binding oxidoreductase [Haloferax mediterranei ATCC 33500]|uniref:FAD-binding oxidoreductase n=1 Tax=Haloferax mediterranei (strain ATCC 33500 / DSM 1411 / JCM 8866 / NBRC 14739 / NCIMB 2177 / R-4) TaxID=523841 RepID=I3R2I6_HALMT|nr:FAD-binding oxidoreductase [Haloferax mediterranei]AFK18446.1 sarcosine oxidase beta subunit [Haloferax mediterranei ATCC 33500]AHZ22166.1 sarcosine oxidase [Haloferax mediterranei ATCC 33500]EMA02279.1 sarcosine oxidase beta subunit [Haloferax mediterranei ATCC 33500]MDX5988538.1 FAD-binding oxidoreductase [Haloferax mediterranei ATCC 33500]QCQ74953.1 FAD-binding oxidoreductase [Haloferax mediterranei ATCC 33500]